jgi:hypothetical protein
MRNRDARTVRSIAEKLRLTAAALDCAGQKELCAAFRRVNPNTTFALDRSYKWMQGRSLPRSARLYEGHRQVGQGLVGRPRSGKGLE